jgi:hypothetical protein
MNVGPTGDDHIALSNELINFPSRSYSAHLDGCARQKGLETRVLNPSQVYKPMGVPYLCTVDLHTEIK